MGVVAFTQAAWCGMPGGYRSMCGRYEVVATLIKEGGRLTSRVEYQVIKLDAGGRSVKTSRTFSGMNAAVDWANADQNK